MPLPLPVPLSLPLSLPLTRPSSQPGTPSGGQSAPWDPSHPSRSATAAIPVDVAAFLRESGLPTPHRGPQTALLNATHDEVFYGGAKGGGKSFGILLKALSGGLRWGSAFRGLLLRATERELEPLLETSRHLFEPVGGRFTSRRGWSLPNGATLRVGHVDRGDLSQFQGTQPTHVFLDEAGQVEDQATVLALLKEVRSPEGIPTQMILTGNPGGPGEMWLRKRYVEGGEEGTLDGGGAPVTIRHTTDQNTGLTRCFIPARLSDNPTLSKGDPGYEGRLRLALRDRPNLLRALLEGDFFTEPDSGIIKADLFRPLPPEARLLRTIWAWDTAYETGAGHSWSAGVLLGECDTGGIAVLRVYRGRREFDDLLDAMTSEFRSAPADLILVEDRASGRSIVQALRRRRLPVEPFPLAAFPGDKAARHSVAAMLLSGTGCFVPPDAEWLTVFRNELLRQPDWPENDQADAWAMGVYYLRQLKPTRPSLKIHPETLQLWRTVL